MTEAIFAVIVFAANWLLFAAFALPIILCFKAISRKHLVKHGV